MDSIHVSDDLSIPSYFTIAFSMRPHGVIEGNMKSTIAKTAVLTNRACTSNFTEPHRRDAGRLGLLGECLANLRGIAIRSLRTVTRGRIGGHIRGKLRGLGQ